MDHAFTFRTTFEILTIHPHIISTPFFWYTGSFAMSQPLRVEVVFKRKAEKITLNRRQREGLKARQIHEKYPKEKADKLITNLRTRGLWYWDPDFKGDEEDSIGHPLAAISFTLGFHPIMGARILQ